MILGTTIKITATLDQTPDSITIDVYDPNDSQKVTAQNMTLDSGYIYYYLYQNATTDTSGDYKARVNAVKGAYTTRSKKIFRIESL